VNVAPIVTFSLGRVHFHHLCHNFIHRLQVVAYLLFQDSFYCSENCNILLLFQKFI